MITRRRNFINLVVEIGQRGLKVENCASAMTKTVETNISLGRPFGGTGFLFNKKYAKCLKPLLSFAHDRVTALQLESPNEKIILINVYFPYYNVRDIDNHVAMYSMFFLNCNKV